MRSALPCTLTPQEARYWRLLGECERICEEECQAIGEKNFSFLSELLDRKAAVVDALFAYETIIEKERPDDYERYKRIQAIKNRHLDNQYLLQRLQQDISDQKQKLRAQYNQKKALLTKYYTVDSSSQDNSHVA